MNCHACEIVVAPGYIETSTHRVGDMELCGDCYAKLRQRGKLTLTNWSYLTLSGEVMNERKQRQENRNNEIVSLFNEGWTLSRLTAKFKISRSSVQQIIYRAREANLDRNLLSAQR